MKLAVVIIHYNTSADLENCLVSLRNHPPAAEHQVIVVDNASAEPGLAEVRARHPECRWVMSPENLGYARGSNLGMAQVTADYYLILNPDIVVEPGALDSLLDFAEAHPRAGIVGPQLLNPDGSIQDSCRRFYTLKTLLLRRTFLGKLFPASDTVNRHLMRDFDHLSSRPVDWVLGGCLLVRRTAMDRTGPMDERFFLYFEDVDWCYRMWQAGFEVQYAPAAKFFHHHRRDSARGRFNRSFWLHLGSLISFYEKWGMFVWLLKKWRDPLLVLLLWMLDMAGLTAAFGLAYGLRGAMGGLFSEPLYPVGEYLPLMMFSGLLASLTFLLTGRYSARRHRDSRSLGEHLQQVGVVAVLLMASTYLGHLEVISRAVLLMFIPLLAVTTAAGERLFRRILRKLERGHFVLERTLLAGPPETIAAWLDRAGDLAAQGVDVAGFVADARDDGGRPPLGRGDVPWLGHRRDILEVVRRYRISQVVFWERPGDDPEGWRRLAALRAMRIRLRWNVEDVWLLAAGARIEVFGGALSAVKGSDSVSAARALGGRLLSMAAGLILGVAGFPAWVWFRAVMMPAGRGRLVQVPVVDPQGDNRWVTLAATEDDRIRPLPWQWALSGSLLRGRLALSGPRPVPAGDAVRLEDPGAMLAFWGGEPGTPGLTGPWCAPGQAPESVTLAARWRQLWNDPGGFNSRGAGDAKTGGTTGGTGPGSASPGEVSST